MMMAEGVEGVGRSRGRKRRGSQGTPTARGAGEGGEEELPTFSHAGGRAIPGRAVPGKATLGVLAPEGPAAPQDYKP